MGDRLYSSNPADRAKDLLSHYMKLVFDQSGLRFDSDNQVELDQIIDEIVSAQNLQIKELNTKVIDLTDKLERLTSMVKRLIKKCEGDKHE
jgi:hypothetical protein